MMNLVWLRSFCTLVEVGHFTRTAERLNMTQSGVSQHIRKLEQQLGTELLLREGKQFTLSEAGEKLYGKAKLALQQLEDLEQSVKQDPPYEGLVRIMSPGSIGLKLYPQLLALQHKHPKLVIDYRFAPNADIEQAIAESTADLGLVSSSPDLADVDSCAIAEEELLLVSPKTLSTPDWQSLMALGFIDHPDGAHHASLLLSANYPEFQHCQQLPRSGFCNQIGLILQPVSMGLGFTVLPAHAVAAFQPADSIRVHKLAQTVSETLFLCHRRNKALPQRMETVLTEVRRWL